MKQVYLESRKAHKDAVISTVCYKDAGGRKLPNMIFSASEDGTIKLWDLRINKAVKLLQHPSLKSDSYSNLQVDSDKNILYIASEEKLIAFDIKTDKLLINEPEVQPISTDSINCLDLQGDTLAYIDDE